MCRNPCKECPWVNKSVHNKKMISFIKRLYSKNIKSDFTHKCHMIDSNIWSTPNIGNVCIGSLKATNQILGV